MTQYLLPVLLMIFLPISAFAAAAPSPTDQGVDFTQSVLDATGKPVPDFSEATTQDPTCRKCPPLSRGAVIAACLIQEKKPGQSPALWNLAVKVADPNAKDLKLSTTEVHAILACLDDGAHPALLLGQMQSLLDPQLPVEPLK